MEPNRNMCTFVFFSLKLNYLCKGKSKRGSFGEMPAEGPQVKQKREKIRFTNPTCVALNNLNFLT
ncbi:hypothetical protein OESDEN_20925 [Oesophagostomum dentatum]|uniref:Uncharacterized protein n=1 Tax=Oesophagostomum dentatum TaxID=61180 RepID=A0A0B1S3C2_OESDE|nr:hypothetical protein OESDEN_20925 [Oesophagostomum dentatum]